MVMVNHEVSSRTRAESRPKIMRYDGGGTVLRTDFTQTANSLRQGQLGICDIHIDETTVKRRC